MSALFVVAHDAAHGALFRSKRLNSVVGHIAMLPSWHVYEGWVLGHNRIHHAYTVREGFDFVWHPYTPEQYAAMTPLQKLTGWSGWIVVRRQLGLWAFAYIVLHVLAYLFFILGLDWGQLAVELRKRPYIIVGALGFLGLLALAVTSNRYSQRRLGARWKKLHRLVYVILGLGFLHFLWIVRSDLREWAIYAVIGAVLMVLRVPAVARVLPRIGRR